jgi:glyceraldehyde-3-phosphate dehydrogenase/erythrose-4-phosphate dehydrogenase
MRVRVAINGFGRVGRCFMRVAYDSHADIEMVAVNDLAAAPALAHLLKHDSVFGSFRQVVAEGSRSTGPVSWRWWKPIPAHFRGANWGLMWCPCC